LASQGLVGESHAHLPFVGGLMGYWRYDLGSSLLGLPPAPGGETPLPRMKLGWYGWGLIINHQAQRGWLVFHSACDRGVRDQVMALVRGNESPTPTPFRLTAPFSATIPRERYLAAVAAIKEYI